MSSMTRSPALSACCTMRRVARYMAVVSPSSLMASRQTRTASNPQAAMVSKWARTSPSLYHGAGTTRSPSMKAL